MQQQPVRRFPLGGDLYAYVSPSEHKVELRIGRIQMATDRKGGWTEMEGSDVRLDLKKWRRLVAMERKLTEEFERHQVAWQNFQRGRKRASLQERRNQDKKKLRLENDDDGGGGVVLQQQKQTNNDYPRAFLNVGALTPKYPLPAKEEEEDDDPAAATKEKEEDDVAADKEEEEEEEAPAAAAAAVAAAAAAVKEEEHSCCCT